MFSLDPLNRNGVGLDHVLVKEVASGRETEAVGEREVEMRKNHEALDREWTGPSTSSSCLLLVHV